MEVVPYRGEDGEGEVGILAPEHVDARGIWTHKWRKPLCRLPDGPGFPVLAVINDDSIPENRSFDGIRGTDARDIVRSRVRTSVEEVFEKWFQAPHGVLSERRVALEIPDTPLFVAGVLWLPPSFLHAGRVEVRDAANKSPVVQSFIKAKKNFDGSVPVCGRLLIAMTGSRAIAPANKTQELLTDWLIEETATLLSGLGESAPADAVDNYRFILRFLGHKDGTTLDALAGDGRRIDVEDIQAELSKTGRLWYSRKEGSAEGAFPGAAPPFFLIDDNGPLFTVLKNRAGAALREVGGAPQKSRDVDAENVMLSEQPLVELSKLAPKPKRSQETRLSPLPFVAPEVLETPNNPDDETEPASSFFKNLVQRVVLLFDKPLPHDPATRAFGPTLLAAIEKLGLAPTNIVTGLRYSRSGRPITFDAATGKLILNRAHPAVRDLAQKASTDPACRIALIAASVREINRVLEVVTDATEQRVLFGLLRGDPI